MQISMCRVHAICHPTGDSVAGPVADCKKVIEGCEPAGNHRGLLGKGRKDYAYLGLSGGDMKEFRFLSATKTSAVSASSLDSMAGLGWCERRRIVSPKFRVHDFSRCNVLPMLYDSTFHTGEVSGVEVHETSPRGILLAGQQQREKLCVHNLLRQAAS